MVDAQLKANVQKWMAEWLSGPDYDGKIERERRARFPDIQRASFYRWWRLAKVQAAKVGAIDAQQAARVLVAEGERQQRLSVVAAKKAKLKSDARRINAHLPKPISPDSILPVSPLTVCRYTVVYTARADGIQWGGVVPDGTRKNPKCQ